MSDKKNNNMLDSLFDDIDLDMDKPVSSERPVMGVSRDGALVTLDEQESIIVDKEGESHIAATAIDRASAFEGTTSEQAGSSGGDEPPPITQAMTGDQEEDGTLTLARYASRAYLEYAMSVVKSRALPEVCDGQKPVQRRILIDMDRMGLRAGAKSVKSARVVGDVLGKYHPHGDQSVYDAMVRMAQSFMMRYPLVDGQGNFGSRDGDSQAAMRYTEARLTPIASLLLDEVDSGAVDFVANYDGNFTEPTMLPAKLPFVLLNGASGIAVGMATEIPSHNLREVAAATTLLIEHPESTLDDVMKLLPAPDFPCGAQIITPANEIRDIYRTGRGSVKVRARYHFEELARGQWQLVIDELPPAASSQSVLSRIEEITNPKVKAGKRTLTSDQQQAKTAMLSLLERARDESGKNVAVRLVFEPKTSKVDRDEFVRALLVQTDLESNVSVNLVMIGIDGKPRQKSLLDILHEWIAFRTETVRRRSAARLEKVLDRIHVLEGRTIALINIDRVIEIIRTAEEPKAALMAEFALSERQADDILEIRLRQLARLEALAIEKELAALEKEKAAIERILGNEGALKRLIAKEIEEATKTFGDERRTLVEEAQRANAEPIVLDEPVTVVISKKGFIRTRTGHGHDCSLMNFKMGDGLSIALECRTTDTLIAVGDNGRVYTLTVSALPGGRGDGLPLSSFIDLEPNAELSGWLIAGEKTDVVLATTEGMGLICQSMDMVARLRAGKLFVRVAPGFKMLPPMLVSAGMTKLACLSGKGRLLIIDIEEIRRLPAGGKGVTLMGLEINETLIAAKIVSEEGVLVCGIGRGNKPRQALVNKQAFIEHTGRRARKGRQLSVTWRAETLEAVVPKKLEPLDSTSGDLVIEVVDEATPTLL